MESNKSTHIAEIQNYIQPHIVSLFDSYEVKINFDVVALFKWFVEVGIDSSRFKFDSKEFTMKI